MIPSYEGEMPYLTTEEMVEVDRSMIEDYKINLLQMMENAGRNLAHLARTHFFNGDPRERTVAVLAGSGGNGGGAMVCARRLHIYGAHVTVFLTRSADSLKSVPAHQLEILHRIGIPILEPPAIIMNTTPELIIDGLIGYSLEGAPRGQSVKLIEWANHQEADILSLDVPSGLDATSGTVYTPAIHASATMTLALPKQGLREPGNTDYIGELFLADISVPREVYASPRLRMTVPSIFALGDIVRLP